MIVTVLKKLLIDHRLKSLFIETRKSLIEKFSKENYKKNLMFKLMHTITLNIYF